MQTLHHDLIPALWVIWLAYWLVASVRTKPVQRRESLGSRLSHIVLLVAGMALLISRRHAGLLLTERFLPAAGWAFWLGAALVAAGLAFAIWARVHLAGNWSGTVTLKQNHSLTRDGPYRFVRHPIYTGILTAVLGTALVVGDWRGLLALALVTLAFVRKIAIEERFLTDLFGEEYQRYRHEVPALIPRLGA